MSVRVCMCPGGWWWCISAHVLSLTVRTRLDVVLRISS